MRLNLNKAVPQEARLALNVVEPLEEMKARLRDPEEVGPEVRAKVDINEVIGKIDAVIDSLEDIAAAASKMTILSVRAELDEEGRDRSEGQNRRQARVEACD
ncbi:MAG: hypothetical protein NWE76_01925 [Candidatus Bathyarchaeota archaeon]|nr:hypothetical protein [Candidatus Bathyarchaeota archaeon]